MAKMIWVEATEKAGKRVAFQEFHPDHPKRREDDATGEAFVHKGNSPQKVAKTGGVNKAIGNGMLAEVDAPVAKGKPASKTAEDGKAPSKKESDDKAPSKKESDDKAPSS